MKILGITGGVGSGKSRVLAYLEDTYGAVVCQADHIAWELQMPDTDCYCEIVRRFGARILHPDKTIDRAKLGQLVFADAGLLEALNQIMHPAVKREVKKRMQVERQRGTRLFVLEAALLIEEDYGEICDELWYIYTSEPVRRERLKTSRAYSDEKIDAIMASQLSEERFRTACHRVIENSGAFEETALQIRQSMMILEKDR
ncbi:MAG: dephospho-CoA kinase [Faecalimonas sp.]|nr:dephospho-CoA kinase [Faecalimonas sp.]